MTQAREVTLIHLDEVEKIDLPQGSWSAMVINNSRVSGNQSTLGYSVFKPGTHLPMVKHETEEVALVVSGTGELHLEDRIVTYKPGDALHIPAGVWHAVVNNSTEDIVMVFGFPHPDYPPTERRG